ncbi:Twinkle protein, mitochondrial [Seminavis robusta]|uniref:Twinkle protein, mitochondrial n=1 Tax=Seminavis robusta TaxID=568900 RepID=A0A9N8H2N6_9STRA|nr:Twinkle protein, mitochondrial [Seminavis robusta]|eukprot:Sro12_g009200.1 Twinkle protein, mitochondrial (771) ;mRNA; r:35940-38618
MLRSSLSFVRKSNRREQHGRLILAVSGCSGDDRCSSSSAAIHPMASSSSSSLPLSNAMITFSQKDHLFMARRHFSHLIQFPLPLQQHPQHLPKQLIDHPHQQQQVRTKVFVSSHNDMNITSNQILDYCGTRGIQIATARVTSSHVVLKECPFCDKPTNNKADNEYKCYINIGGGAYFCHRCGNGGSWFDFKAHLRGYQHTVTTLSGGGSPPPNVPRASTAKGAGAPINISSSSPAPLRMPKQRLQSFYISNLLDSNDKKNDEVLDYLKNTRGLNEATLRKYGVGRAKYQFPSNKGGEYVDAECITFPWIMTVGHVKEQEELRGAEFTMPSRNGSDAGANAVMDDSDYVTRRIKVRALKEKGWQRLDPAGGGWGLFGFHTVENATELVLTEGEFDAMAVYQATGRPAVSLPNGCRSLPMEVLPMLERFEKIYLWMDHDGPGQEGAKQFAQKIGMQRCYIVQPLNDQEPCKDANEALLKGLDLEAMIKKASVTKHENVMDFEAIRNDVIHEILNPNEYSGVPMPSLPLLTKLIKGFRRGELTVLTGPTGSGKTTFLGQLSLDLAEQDVNVMWGSFEIKNTRLAQKLLQQYNRKPLPTAEQPDAQAVLHALADRFSALPMHFMKFHGGSDLEDVLDAMEYAVYVSDVEHIILDNLQFMISRNTLNKSFDKFDIQDVAIEKFRKFATDRNVHVTLVVHPRKEDESSKLNISSIYGSAKATQEADTVMILQSELMGGNRRKYIDVKKNRFDGSLGQCPLHFDGKSSRYGDTPIAC